MRCTTQDGNEHECGRCVSVTTTSDLLLRCACDAQSAVVHVADGVCAIETFLGDRRLDEPLTVVTWNDPWTVAAYVLFGLLAVLTMVRIYAQCSACRDIRMT